MIGEVRTLVLIDQLRAADNELHLGEYVTHLTVEEIADINRALRDVLDLVM
jgi:hypothetical protein